MAKRKSRSNELIFTGNKVLWIAQAEHFPQLLKRTEDILDQLMDRRWSRQEVHGEASIILGFLLQETDCFADMNDAEKGEMIYRFCEKYVDIRDEEWHPGISLKNIVIEVNILLNYQIEPKPEPELIK